MSLIQNTALGIALPFIGTALGAAAVFIMKREPGEKTMKLLIGFASGVMIAASVWSLLIPAIDMETGRGGIAWVPAVGGFLVGIAFLLFLDRLIVRFDAASGRERLDYPENCLPGVGGSGGAPASCTVTSPEKKDGSAKRSGFEKSLMLVIAVTLHNLPEGMAVGVVFAGLLAGSAGITVAGAVALSVGIAVQNFPEGAIISMPLSAKGMKRRRAFLYGVLSGVVEPAGALLTLLLTTLITPILPYILSFAAGAMIYVVVEELIPEAKSGAPSYLPTTGVAIGFSLMMLLDVALG